MPVRRWCRIVLSAGFVALGAAVCTAQQLIPRSALFGNPERAEAQLSPDGTRIAFLAPVHGVLNVWVAPVADAGSAKPVTQDTQRGIHQYFWAQSGSRILYLQDRGGDENFQLHDIDPATGADRDLTGNTKVRTEVIGVSPLRPDELLIGFNDRDPRYHDVYRLDLRTGRKTLVFKNEGYTEVLADEQLEIRFAYRANPDGSTDIVRLAGGKAAKAEPFLTLTSEDAFSSHLLGFNRSGTVVYMFDSRKRDKAALVALDPRTGQESLLAESAQADVSGVLSDPNTGQPLAYEVDYLVRELLPLDASVRDDLSQLKAKLPGSFRVMSQSRANDAWLVLADPVSEPAAYYLWDRKQHDLRRLFSARPRLEKVGLAAMHPFELKARDGRTLTAYLTLPKGAELTGKGLPVPLVLTPHGGPWARDSFGFHAEHQWLASRGYAALSINFRGSTGFGKGFVNAGNGEWAGKMHDDLIDGVQWAIQHKITTPQKVAILGTSYGGYSTLVGLTFTPQVFACGVDVAGPVNLETLFNTIPPYWQAFFQQLVTRVGDPRTAAGRVLLHSRSPLTHADDIQRPLLIGQGANDPRVNHAEPEQIVRAMRARHIPVTYVLYPDEGHGFVRPENRISFYALSEVFLARCLGGSHESFGKDLEGSSLQVQEGAELIEGLPAALQAQTPAH